MCSAWYGVIWYGMFCRSALGFCQACVLLESNVHLLYVCDLGSRISVACQATRGGCIACGLNTYSAVRGTFTNTIDILLHFRGTSSQRLSVYVYVARNSINPQASLAGPVLTHVNCILDIYSSVTATGDANVSNT